MLKKRVNNFEIVFIVVMLALITCFIIGFLSDFTGDQANVFFSKTSDYMADYFNTAQYSINRNPYEFGMGNPPKADQQYLPLAYIIFYFLGLTADYLNLKDFDAGRSSIGLATSMTFMFLISAMFYLILYENYRGNKVCKFLVPTIMMMSGIFIFSYERGNIIILAALFMTFFIFNYNSENKIIREISYVLLAIASTLKIYPALLGILILYEKRYKDALRLTIYGVIFAFLPFLFFEGGFGNIPYLFENVKLNTELYEYNLFPRFNFRFWAPYIEDEQLKELIYSWVPIITMIISGVSIITSFFSKKYWKRIMQLLLIIVIIPVNSGKYTGLYIFMGIVLFFNEQEHGKFDWVYLAFFIMILNPFQIIYKGQIEINITVLLMNLSASLMFLMLTGESIMLCYKKIRCGSKAWKIQNLMLRKPEI